MTDRMRRMSDADVAAGVLADALADLAPERTPCQDPGNSALFFDEAAAVRRAAAEACRTSCPVLHLCAEYADVAQERWGVWGGRDRQARASRTHVRPDEADGEQVAS